ncbi:hypothetical protein BAE44_0014257 [Dichanthelium oligosanthes]|uniref:Uncharacterized protein n=1 Tax=Dichanthelium oligosanthes TaxID=888268 RepID=A0A1E5VI36_9POAL|nr:hypothetical protein BAE44_0014257 [Dichanthelium oligosanthes]
MTSSSPAAARAPWAARVDAVSLALASHPGPVARFRLARTTLRECRFSDAGATVASASHSRSSPSPALSTPISRSGAEQKEAVGPLVHARMLNVKTNDYGSYDPSPSMDKPHFKLIPN